MHYLNTVLRLLLTLPAALRLSAVILCAVGIQVLFILMAPMEQNPSILTIPVAITAWMYRRRGAAICIAFLNIASWIYFSIHFKSIWLPRSITLAFLIGIIAMIVTALFISSQRASFEQTEESQRRLARAYEQEQNLHQAKHQFIQNINHELRTPLTALSGCIELLLEQNEHFDKEARVSFLQSAMLSCEELQLLVNNILESLQISAGETSPELKCLNLARSLREMLQQFNPQWETEQQICLDIPEHLHVQAHQPYLSQILRNLLSNAVKYAPGDQPINIAARPMPEGTGKGPEICISVQDTGPGIPQNERARIFEEFTRLQRDALGQVRGSGLGLSISQQLVELMGGRIWAESTGVPGQGSCFHFTLQAAPAIPAYTATIKPGTLATEASKRSISEQLLSAGQKHNNTFSTHLR